MTSIPTEFAIGPRYSSETPGCAHRKFDPTFCAPNSWIQQYLQGCGSLHVCDLLINPPGLRSQIIKIKLPDFNPPICSDLSISAGHPRASNAHRSPPVSVRPTGPWPDAAALPSPFYGGGELFWELLQKVSPSPTLLGQRPTSQGLCTCCLTGSPGAALPPMGCVRSVGRLLLVMYFLWSSIAHLKAASSAELRVRAARPCRPWHTHANCTSS